MEQASGKSYTVSLPVYDERSAATCLAIDGRGNVWAGTAKGTVRVRSKASWDQVGGRGAALLPLPA
jgi:hypothetical protein